MPDSIRPGWYTNPDFHATLMWWDGEDWAEEFTAPAPHPPVTVTMVALGVLWGTLMASAAVAFVLVFVSLLGVAVGT